MKYSVSEIYHSYFSYKLSSEEKKRWKSGDLIFRAEERNGDVLKFTKSKDRNRLINNKKMLLATKTAKLLERVQTILFVGVTGSVAMNSASNASDIDLMVITKNNSLWSTRFLVLMMFHLFGVNVRKSYETNEKDKICLNLWLEISSLSLSVQDRSVYTAHEILATVPLIDRNNTHKLWVKKNNWVFDYWPNAYLESKVRTKTKKNTPFLFEVFNFPLYLIQYLYMKSKITREKVNLHEAYFHPNNLNDKINSFLKKNGIIQKK